VSSLYFKYEHNDKRQRKVYTCVHSFQIIRLVLSQVFWMVKALPHLFYIHIGV
jgi:hypothetical protein